MNTKFPSIASVRSALAAEKRSLRKFCSRDDLLSEDGGPAFTDVRLQVYEDGSWSIRTGSSDYDQDHRGHWGASSLSYDRENLRDLARDLLEQAKEHALARSAWIEGIGGQSRSI